MARQLIDRLVQRDRRSSPAAGETGIAARFVAAGQDLHRNHANSIARRIRRFLSVPNHVRRNSSYAARPITLPDGSQRRLIGCGGIQHDMLSCYVKAGEVCPAGYDIITASQGNGPNSAAASLIGGPSGIDRSLLVRCH
jgi:hypothetical protein